MMLYMAVTADALELPCFVAETHRELSKMLGIDEAYFSKLLKQDKPYKKLGVKFVKVEE